MIRHKTSGLNQQITSILQEIKTKEHSLDSHTGSLLGLLIILAIFSALAPSFRQIENLVLLARTASIAIGIVAVGQTVVLISGGIDLSVGSVVAFTSLISAQLMVQGLGPIAPMTGMRSYLAILIGWLAGITIGAAQGWLITKSNIPAFIATLGTMVTLRGVSVGISGGYTVSGLSDEFQWIANSNIGFLPVSLLFMLGIYLLTAYFLRRTKAGRYCYAIGGNQTAARLSGIKIDRYRVLYYAYSGLLAAVVGTLLSAYIDGANFTNGEGYEFSSIAASIIGGTSLSGGVGSVWGTLIGVMILTIVPNGMVMVDAPYWGRDVATGVVILLAVLIDMNRQKARKAARVPIDVPPPTFTGSYLSRVLSQFSQLIYEHTGCSSFRLFLTDRDTGDLVQQEVHMYSNDGDLQGKGHISGIVNEVRNSLLIVRIDNLDHETTCPTTKFQPNSVSAIAMPLLNDDQWLVGVIELQSTTQAAFDDTFIAIMNDVIDMVVVNLEDAWLFESGWLTRTTRDALRHLWDDLYLGRSGLFNWIHSYDSGVGLDVSTGERGAALRTYLLQAIGDLAPNHEGESSRLGTRRYRILMMTYVQEQAVQQILRLLHISRRQYFYDLKDAIEVLVDQLVRNRVVKGRDREKQFT
jgi:ribose transport system permease protein